jgi:hypothetical protein
MRYYNFALEVAKNFEVTLMVPSPVDFEVEGFDVVQAQAFGGRAFGEYVTKFDVLITQAPLPQTMRALANQPVRVIYDLYDPLPVGNLALFAKRRSSPRHHDAILRSNGLAQEIALATGNAFLCASPRQRDLRLGVLGPLGRLDQNECAGVPSLRRLIDVVPVGLSADSPMKSRRVLKRVVPGIGEADRMLSWGGSIWNWFDRLR